jgi:putative transposase
VSNLRRYFENHRVAFLTNVTFERQPLLVKHIDLFQLALDATRKKACFEVIAWAVVPDHFHCVIRSESENPSAIMRRLKLSFSERLRYRMNVRSGRVWQYRFWDHMIRNQRDLNRHIDYVHYNPTKHGLVGSPIEWRYSSFDDYVKQGLYREDWGAREPVVFEGNFGE